MSDQSNVILDSVICSFEKNLRKYIPIVTPAALSFAGRINFFLRFVALKTLYKRRN